MPTIRIDIFEGRTIDQKRALAKALTGAVVETLEVPATAVTVKIIEGKRENHANAGVLAIDR